MASILLLEDDVLLGSSIEDYFKQKGFQVKLLHYPSEFSLERLALFDLLILDLILPDISGEEILARIKKRFPDFPVLILTAKGQIESKKQCFELGADDYLVKPFEILELFLRVKALLKRTKQSKKIFLKDTLIDLEAGVVIKNNQEIKLSPRAWDLLNYLIAHQGEVVGKDQILAHVWKGISVTEESVRTYIKELRKILPPGSIQTFKGRGYRFCVFE